MGVFFIGEKPSTGIPFCLRYRASVVDARISGLESFSPIDDIAYLKSDHRG